MADRETEEHASRPEPETEEHADKPAPESGASPHRIVLRPIANPLALGFLGLAGATAVLSGVELGWIGPHEHTQAAVIMLVFAPALQLVACLFGFLARDAVASTGMGVLAGTWAVVGAMHLLSGPHGRSSSLATLLLVSAAALLLNSGTAALSKVIPAAVVALAGVRFTLTAVYQLSGSAAVRTAAGYLGCVLAALAMYAAFATELQSATNRPLLPLMRRRAGRSAFDPYLSEQVRHLASEPGVRREL